MAIAEFSDDLVNAVRHTAGNAAACDAVEQLYKRIERELARIRPVCAMSGRCCRFEEYGHRLYVTTAELGAFVRRARQETSLHASATGEDGGGCRFQQGKMCLAHAIRPMGCRLFFCDTGKETELQALYEELHSSLKHLHEQLSVSYYYLEWRTALQSVYPLIVAG